MITSRGSLFSAVREQLQRRLSRSTYVKIAGLYHTCLARLVERSRSRGTNAIVSCSQPLIYISQPPRSGGTLLRNLIDGHPLLHAFPHELSWEKNGYRWEGLGALDGRSVYDWLYDRWLDGAIVQGLDKELPFEFNRTFQKRLFFQLANSSVDSDREWLDIYMTSFFNAWTDYQGLYGEKRFTVAFCPWNLESIALIDRFFRVYPSGFRIHVIRNPLGWWASEKKYGEKTKQLGDYLNDRWMKSTEIGLHLHEKYPQSYILVHFDDLVRRPEHSMCSIANRIGVNYTPLLTKPTINRIARSSNTSFGSGTRGLDFSVLNRWRGFLTDREIDLVRETADSLYQKAIGSCINRVKR